nr:immunoglobulin heavy chain junction region [Mus musculus]
YYCARDYDYDLYAMD